jgi:hypothetical protein
MRRRRISGFGSGRWPTRVRARCPPRMPSVPRRARCANPPPATPMQIPGAGGGAHDVVASLNDGGRNVPIARHVVEQLGFAAQEAAVHEVVAFDSRNRQREMVLAPFLDVVAVAVQETGGRLPNRPRARRRQCGALIAADQAFMVGAQEIVAFIERNGVAVALPGVGKYLRGAVLIEPADLGIAQQENPAQHDFADALGIGLRIGQRQGAAP